MIRHLTEARSAEARRRGAISAVRIDSRPAMAWMVTLFVGSISIAAAQQLLDRVVARVGTTPITQTDVEAALAFGVVERLDGSDARTPVQQMIDRRLMLNEVNRFPPAEPTDSALAELVARMREAAGPDAEIVMKRTGVDDKRLTDMARDTLRIQAYLTQRFGTGPRADQQIARWQDDLRMRGDVVEFTLR